MKRRVRPCLVFLVFTLGVSLGAWAQDNTPPPSSAPAPSQDSTSSQESAPSPGPKPQYTKVDPGKSLDFLGEVVGRSNLNLGMLVLAAYDTNVATFAQTRQPQMSYLFGPHIGIAQYRPKLALNLAYDGGLGIYSQLSNSNAYSQSATGDILYQISSHWQAHASDRYSYSADPFGSYYTIVGQPSPSNPNPNTYVPFAITNQNEAEMDMAYQLSRYDTITFTGNETFRRYSNYSPNYSFQAGLYNLISYSGGANYSHKLSARLSLGGGYNFTSLDFSHGQQRSGISAIQGFVNYQMSRSFSVSGWAGPEYITAKTLLLFSGKYYTLLQNDWVPAFGINLGWQGLRQSFTAGLSRQVSDGGGLLATTTVYSVNMAYHRQLSARWDGLLSAQYGNNASFAASNLNKQLFPDRKYTLLTTLIQLDRTITPQLTAHLAYSYVRETQKNIYIVDAAGTFNDNRVSILLQYTWNHPLGQ